MIIKCDACLTAFNIKDELIKPGGSKVRCAKCKEIFIAYPKALTDTQTMVKLQPRPKVEKLTAGAISAAATETAPVRQAPPKPSPAPSAAEAEKLTKTREIPLNKPSDDEYDPHEETYLIENTLTNVDFMESAFGDHTQITERYEEMGMIGKGGMGEVLLAKDTQLLRKVAIKVLKDNSPAALSYFLREAQITAQLDHPNIVPLYTVKPPDMQDQHVSFVMKLVKGKTLSEIIAKARKIYKQNSKAELEQEICLTSRLEYFLKACEGISYAHRKQVVHRDLKPANIMIGDFGEVYVMDWGIAKMLKEDDADDVTAAPYTQIYTGEGEEFNQPETQIGGIVGTLSYMSPEQAKGLPDVGIKSDIFSLGAILYELVTLKPARVGDSAQKLQWAQEGYLNTMEHIVPEQKIPAELKAIIYKATAFAPRDRYAKISALADDVRAFLRGDEVSEHPDNIPRKVWRWMSKHREITVIVLLAAFLLFSFMTIFSLYRERSAMLAAQIREQRLTLLQADVSAQAHQIDGRFQHLENLAAELARNAMYLLQYAPANTEKFYWITDYVDPLKKPTDYVMSDLYLKPVSIEYPVVKPAPGVDPETVAPTMQKLAPLRYHFKEVLLASRGSDAPLSAEEANRLLTVHGLPIRWAFIGLEVGGVMYSYPGKETYSPEYDPRRRPWYDLGARKTSVRWGNPYMDNQGQGLVLPCATSLYDAGGQFIGVLGMDVTFSDIIRVNLTRKAKVGVIQESFLLDEKGQVVVSSTQLTTDKVPVTDSGKLLLSLFPVKEVVDAVLRLESGLAEVKRDGTRYIYAYYQMPSVGWFYVEEMQISSIF